MGQQRPHDADGESDERDDIDEQPIDLAAVHADDVLVDALAAGDLSGAIDRADPDDPVVALLAAWAADAQRETPPPPTLSPDEPQEPEFRPATPSGTAARTPSSSSLRWTRPAVAAVAVAAVLALGLVGIGATEAQPDDPLWALSAAINPERARSVVAAAEVSSALERARTALQDGRSADAARELQAMSEPLAVVRDQEGRSALYQEQAHLAAAVAAAVQSAEGPDSGTATAPKPGPSHPAEVPGSPGPTRPSDRRGVVAAPSPPAPRPSARTTPSPPGTGTKAPAPPDTGHEPAPPDTGHEPAPPDTGHEPTPPDTGHEPTPPDTGHEPTPPPPTRSASPPPASANPAPPPPRNVAPPSLSSGEAAPPTGSGRQAPMPSKTEPGEKHSARPQDIGGRRGPAWSGTGADRTHTPPAAPSATRPRAERAREPAAEKPVENRRQDGVRNRDATPSAGGGRGSGVPAGPSKARPGRGDQPDAAPEDSRRRSVTGDENPDRSRPDRDASEGRSTKRWWPGQGLRPTAGPAPRPAERSASPRGRDLSGAGDRLRPNAGTDGASGNSGRRGTSDTSDRGRRKGSAGKGDSTGESGAGHSGSASSGGQQKRGAGRSGR